MYIAIEGPMGVGKTSLATLLSNKHMFKTIFEPVSNPVLEREFAEFDKIVLSALQYYSAKRFETQKKIKTLLENGETIVTDYVFEKDFFYAYHSLSSSDLERYKLFQEKHKIRSILKPDLLVFLTADLDIVIRRIQNRGRKNEVPVDVEFVREIVDSYQDFISSVPTCKLISIDTSRMDFLSSNRDREMIMSKLEIVISRMIK